MREVVAQSNNFTKRQAINSKNGFALQELDDGAELTIISAAMMKVSEEDTGEIKDVSVLNTEDGTCYTAISGTIYDTMGDIIDLIDEEGQIRIRINKRTSKGNGRTFLTLTVL